MLYLAYWYNEIVNTNLQFDPNKDAFNPPTVCPGGEIHLGTTIIHTAYEY